MPTLESIEREIISRSRIPYEYLHKTTRIYDRDELNILRSHTCNFYEAPLMAEPAHF